MRRIQSSFYLSERFSSVNRAETKPEVTFPDMRLFPPRGHVLLYETARARRASSSTSAPCGGAQGGRAGEARVAGCSHTAAKLLSATFCQCELRYSPRLCVISHAPEKTAHTWHSSSARISLCSRTRRPNRPRETCWSCCSTQRASYLTLKKAAVGQPWPHDTLRTPRLITGNPARQYPDSKHMSVHR